MQTQDTRTPAERMEQVERRVLYLLTDEQPVWSIEDLAREVENAEHVRIAVQELLGAGLVAKAGDGCVFATRATVRIVELIGGTINV
jgi:glutamine synthetase adenylyltransferase